MKIDKSVLFRPTSYLAPKYWSTWVTFGLLRLATLFPYAIHIRLGRFLGRLIQRLAGKKVSIVDTNLELCFPHKSIEERNNIKNRTYENYGISLLELAMCWWWKEERLKPLVEVRGLEHIENCLKNKQAVILLSGHFTSLEIGGRLLALYLPFQAMYRTQKNQLFDSYLYTKRSSYLADVISRKNTRRILRGLRGLIPAWYAPDQNFARERNVFAPFFGVPTATITASTRLAASGKAAILPYYPERKSDGNGYVLWIEPPLDNFPSGDEVIDATAINATIEKFVIKNPDQYMWMHPRFKTRPEGEPDIYQ
jgi:KDO2-lipid IV(A) lauroyltransferase